jgi:hypothetical protein
MVLPSTDMIGVPIRVTRLGELSPFGRLFSLEFFLKLPTVRPNSWTSFVFSKSYVLTLSKKGLDFILGDFFTNLCGHPGVRANGIDFCSVGA